MDPMLVHATKFNDREKFESLVGGNVEFLRQKSGTTGNTALHLVSRLGHVELAKKIIELCPELVAAENGKKETPFHEACKQGHVDILLLLLQSDPWAACQLNEEHQSPLFVACSRGHVDVVKLLLQWVRELEGDGDFDPSCLHVAASGGHTGVVQEILKVCPDIALKVDVNGSSALHLACLSGHSNVARLLLQLHPDLSLKFNKLGYLPLHSAAINGKFSIFEDFLQLAPMSFHYCTIYGDPIMHLTLQFNQFDAFLKLLQTFHRTGIFYAVDSYGNGLLHLAVLRGRTKFVDCLINKTKVPINSQNYEGLTALDMLDQLTLIKITEESLVLEAMLRKAGGKKSSEMSSTSSNTAEGSSDLDQNLKEYSSQQNDLDKTETEDRNHPLENVEKAVYSEAFPISRNGRPRELRVQNQLSDTQKRQLEKMKNDHRRQKEKEMYKESLKNTQNTVTLIAILIATVSFTASISPPGGLHQDGEHRGKTVLGKTEGYKVFLISNSLALFTSLCIVIVLVGIIPYKSNLVMRLLVITHRLMWLSLGCMGTAFVSATWLTMPREDRLSIVVMVVCVGTIGTLAMCSSVLLAVNCWMKMTNPGKETPEPEYSTHSIETTTIIDGGHLV